MPKYISRSIVTLKGLSIFIQPKAVSTLIHKFSPNNEGLVQTGTATNFTWLILLLGSKPVSSSL